MNRRTGRRLARLSVAVLLLAGCTGPVEPGPAVTRRRFWLTSPNRPQNRVVRSWSTRNSNYLLLGVIIEKITGLSYAEAVRRDVLAGLGDRMVVQTEERPSPPLAAPDNADSAFPDGQFVPNRALASGAGAAGGIAADAPTLATWGYLLYGGLVLDTERTVDLSTPVAPGDGLGTTIFGGLAGPDLVVGQQGLIPGYSTMLVSVAVLTVGSNGSVLNERIGTRVLTTLSN